jgi:hypothetical protein
MLHLVVHIYTIKVYAFNAVWGRERNCSARWVYHETLTHTLWWPCAERVVRIVTIVVKVTPSILFQELLEFAMLLEVAEGSCKLVAACCIMEWYHRRLWGLGFTVLSVVPQMVHHVWYSCPICSVHKNIAHNTCCCNDAGETFTVPWPCLLSLVFAFAAVLSDI